MTRNAFTRRSILGAGAAATAAATVGTSSIVSAAEPPSDPGPRSAGDIETPGVLRTEALSTLVPGEEVLFFAAADLVPNGSVAGVTSIFFGEGARPSTVNSYLSKGIQVPVGSRLTSIEFVMTGTPREGVVRLRKWNPDSSAPAPEPLFSAALSGSGQQVYSSALSEVVDGNSTYEAFFGSEAGTMTFCRGIRVKYVPRTVGLVPVVPVRVYDSRLNMAPDLNGVLSAGATRTVSVATVRNVTTGALTATTAVPADATAIAYTLTVANTVGAGFLAVNPGGVTAVSASTINWVAAGANTANTGVVKLSADRKVTVVHGGGGGADFVIDIVGYYV
jgi:hypothetical protein